MPSMDDRIEQRLGRFGIETAGIVPRADFVGRVVRAVEGEGTDWSRSVLRWARLGIAVASMAAAACIGLAWTSNRSADRDEASDYGLTEVFE
jgi:hypothetical protein